MLRNRILLVLFVLGLSMLYGCMKGEQTLDKVDVPEDVTVVDEDKADKNKEADGEDAEENGDITEVKETAETVARDIYLFDENGLVVPQTLELPKTTSAASQALEYLVVDGPVTELLPNGFQAVLPAGTEVISVNLKEDGTLVVDLSEDFKQYQGENEVKILEAMTHTLTQFDSVDKIKLWINGVDQSVMPVNGTPIASGYSRANGINLDVKDKPDLQYSEPVTVFYPKSYQGDTSFVPVTTYINNEKSDAFSSIVQTLIEGPSKSFFTKQVFNDFTELVAKPTLADGVLQLEFSDAILKDKEQAIIADDVMATLVKTLTEQKDVEAVKIAVENTETIHSEHGTAYNEPVSTLDVIGKEKM